MSFYKYVVTAQKPTSTQFSVKGSFTCSESTNLILGKGNRIEVYTLTPDGLKPTIEFKGTGEITFPSQPRNETEHVITALDPTCQYLAATLYDSTVTLIILDEDKIYDTAVQRKSSLKNKEGRRRSQESFYNPPPDHINISLPDKQVISLAFLQDNEDPTLLILYEDALEQRFLQIFTIHDRQLIGGNIVLDHFETDANLLISMPPAVGGVLLVASRFVRYLKPNRPPIAIGIRPSTIISYCVMNKEGSRILLGDAEGILYLLTLNTTEQRVESLSFIQLGPISIPSCLSYLENDIVFVGSNLCDSQLIYIERKAEESEDILQTIETFANLGPIKDFCVADKQGQTQIITCSGADKEGSLRVVRNGVGLNELATIPITGAKGVWALGEEDDLLLLSMVHQSAILQLQTNHTIVRLERYSALDLNERTLVAGRALHHSILQVTDRSVRLMEARETGVLLDSWMPESPIVVANINPTQCVISLGHGKIVALQLVDQKLVVVGEIQLDYEVSCIDIHPIGPASKSAFVAVGTWNTDANVCLLSLPQLELIAKEGLGKAVIPRSILISQFEATNYLLVASGDGQFYNFKLDCITGQLSGKKRTFLGKLSTHLTTFYLNGVNHVFAASDKPSVIHSRNQKLIYSSVNLKEVRWATPFNCDTFPGAIALITREGLVIGQMEEIQKLHITKVPTIDTPRRIVYQETSKSFGIITERVHDKYRPSDVAGGFEVLDEQSFTGKSLDRVYFKHTERPLALTTIKFENDSNEYYVVASSKENGRGRILVLSLTLERKLRLVHQYRTKGTIDCIRPMDGKLLASVQGYLCLYRWERTMVGGELMEISSKRLPSVTGCIATHGNFITTGDMAYSVVLFQLDQTTQQLVEVAAHEKSQEVLAMKAIDDNLTLGAEKEGHLFVMEHCQDEASVDEPLLDMLSVWHLGDTVSRFRFGSLGMSNADPDSSPATPSLIFATSSGSIGVIADLSPERFKLLYQMQCNMCRVVKSIGELSHTDWRSVNISNRKEEAIHFIDGDLIESFLDLSPQQMQSVVDGSQGGRKLDLTVEDLCKVVEELMSLHS
ncbi:mono-functional DNA-alkylating methyl methanesulfonate N-term-domain-containing protein [Sporodiniella umbellata]|nr:mono-functional DNA-alkylating methyl methanesulfonate N-term-domain-containing protein [Sporodiniella umbellata]